MLVPVAEITGLGRIPAHRSSAAKWLLRFDVPVSISTVDARKPQLVDIVDLPEPERSAFLARRAETMGLPPGIHDDAAHLAFAAKPMTVQHTAYARAETMMFIAKHEAAGLKWGQISGRLKAEAAKDGSAILSPSHIAVRRWAAQIAGEDIVNWAPALAPAYQGRTKMAELSPEAWAEFETLLGLAGKNGTGWPLKEAWRRIEDQKAARGWARIAWTPTGKAKITGREYRFISPVVMVTKAGEVLAIKRAGLTNDPAINMKALCSVEDESPRDVTPGDDAASVTAMLREALGMAPETPVEDLIRKARAIIAAADATRTKNRAAKEMASSYMKLLAEIHHDKVEASLERARATGKLVPAMEGWARGNWRPATSPPSRRGKPARYRW